MRTQNWMNAGFWLLLGLSAGMILSNVTQVPLNAATGSSDRYEDNTMVTGQAFGNENDLIWLLDYRGARVNCIMQDRTGRVGVIGSLDLFEQFELEEGGRQRPHFMMVTGRFGTQGTDLCFLAEVTSGQLLCIAPPRPQVDTRPTIVDKLQYRPEGEIRNQ